jgi:hypothetical protein
VAQDRQIDLLTNFYNCPSVGTTALRQCPGDSFAHPAFDNVGGCQQPSIVCEKSGTDVTSKSCSCADVAHENSCGNEDDCGCSYPTTITLPGFDLPNDLVTGALRSTDGPDDIVAASDGGLDVVSWTSLSGYRWSGGALFGASVSRVSALDLDGDGILDVVFASTSPCVDSSDLDTYCPIVSTGSGTGCLGVFLRSSTTDLKSALSGVCRRIATPQVPDTWCLADFNGDGHVDVLLSAADQTELTMLLGDGHGAFGAPVPVPLPAGLTGGPLACRDLDGDGRADVALLSRANGTLLVLTTRP